LTGSPGFDRVAGSIPILKKIQNDVVLVKKTKVNRLQPGFCRVIWVTGSTRWVGQVTPGHDFSYFFINPARFQPRVSWVPGRPAGPGFKTMLHSIFLIFFYLFS
jgi:hypothetical protein